MLCRDKRQSILKSYHENASVVKVLSRRLVDAKKSLIFNHFSEFALTPTRWWRSGFVYI